MILDQHYLECLSQASYLIGDTSSGSALIVDPRRDVDLYLEEAERLGLRIEHVVLTHFHADFAAGHLELQARTGCTVHLGARAEAEYEFRPLAEGDVIALGDEVRIEILETPGHTPEGISLVVFDLQKSPDQPHAVLTGDTLFIGDVGRPDLMASIGVTAEELGRMLYASLHGKLMKLPDETLLYPGHGAGSMCGKALGSETVCTIGRQRVNNYALQPMDEEAFVDLVASDQPLAPAYFGYDAEFNRSRHAVLEDTLAASLRARSLDEVLALQADGGQVLDVRDPGSFARGFLAGSWNVGIEGRFATWAGSVLDRARPIVVVAPAGREREAILRLGRIGFDHVVGYLDGGEAAWADRPELVQRIARVDAAALSAALAGAEPPRVLDVRQPGEREQSAIEGSRSIPLGQLEALLDQVPRDRPLVVHCAGGYRSMIAASILAARGGVDRLADLEGGMAAWLDLHASTPTS